MKEYSAMFKVINLENIDDLRTSLTNSGLFDGAWYQSNYEDVTESGLDPLDHFMQFGVILQRDPGPDFSETFFRACLPDKLAQTDSFLLHRLRHGPIEVPLSFVLRGAAALARIGRRADARRMAKLYLGDVADRPLHLFDANIAMLSGSEGEWLKSVNLYLSPYDISEIQLKPGTNLISRLMSGSVNKVYGGPKVSIIMPAYQAAETIRPAIDSIINQSWNNFELLIIDDNSSDGTWKIIQDMCRRDVRIKSKRNEKNYGPYISKNLALMEATGDYITGHDADDWAHPQRIERHLSAILSSGGAIKAGTGTMLRVSPGAIFDNVIDASYPHSPDGFRRRAFISCLFERKVIIDDIGFYDCVKFGADGEYLNRARKILGEQFRDFDIFSMLCLDSPDGLTNHPETGLRTNRGISAVRREYNASWAEWHRVTSPRNLYMDFPQRNRSFKAPDSVISNFKYA